ncbi:FecR domain-containing protein [Prevotella sp. A2931]|uniref:FecR domain-containing protein n=1 Tax=Prevotella illustrans TaxID=2800387 RepID=A0ABS3M7X9_9BACT|nr:MULTISPECIES: FecR domain-containing protein [Prevotella]MBO1364316.1 FecR domain-containing protein [Prevotella illustrans]PTL27306.1 anti-sigma factor [Prevotella sp. oral taxon 820]
MNFKVIKDYILGKSAPKDELRLGDWLGRSKENERLLFGAELLYHEGRGDYDRWAADADKVEASLFAEINRLEERRVKVRYLNFIRYAAVALIMLVDGAAVLWLQYGRQHMIDVTAANGVMALTLPDSTKVWLNQGTTLRYPEVFDGDERHVELAGEALFSVTKNPQKPFIVSSEGVRTKVLGTVFDFKTNVGDNHEEVSLLEGKLEITGSHGEGKVIIQPNQKAVIDKNSHTMEVKNVYAPLEAVWHDGMIPFANMSIADIAHVLERFYQVEISLAGNMDRRQTYSGYIRRTDSIDSVLNALMYSIPFRYHKTGNRIRLTRK